MYGSHGWARIGTDGDGEREPVLRRGAPNPAISSAPSLICVHLRSSADAEKPGTIRKSADYGHGADESGHQPAQSEFCCGEGEIKWQ
jgi:hypothetical protein